MWSNKDELVNRKVPSLSYRVKLKKIKKLFFIIYETLVLFKTKKVQNNVFYFLKSRYSISGEKMLIKEEFKAVSRLPSQRLFLTALP